MFAEETQGHLIRHLLKTICSDITNLMFNSVAADHMLSVEDETTLTSEVRGSFLVHQIIGNILHYEIANWIVCLVGQSDENMQSTVDTRTV